MAPEDVPVVIKLSVVTSDSSGVSGREMMAVLITGERDPQALDQFARTAMRAKIGLLEEAFIGHFICYTRCWRGSMRPAPMDYRPPRLGRANVFIGVLRLEPTVWRDHICSVIARRDFTDDERAGLPPDTPDQPLCP